MKNFKKQFPLLTQYTYLNTAASGLLPEKVLEFRQDHDLDFLISGSILKEKQGEILAEVREAVGGLFGCSPKRVALLPNFSYGFNILMEGVKAGQKVLLLDNDYPSVNWAVESRGFETFYATIGRNLEKNILEAVSAHRPDIFAFSLVQYINGIKLDPFFLKELKKEFPDMLLFADGTQSCGTEVLDFDSSPLDVLGASAYKWMNAGYGNAFFLFKPEMEDKIAPSSLGFNSLQGKYKPHEGSLIGKFEPGHLDTLNFGSLLHAIKFIKQVGLGVIQERVSNLAKEAKASFEDRGLLDSAVTGRELHSSIFNLTGDDALFSFLTDQKIICSRRGGGIRVSFNYFNDSEDLEVLLRALKDR